MRYILDALDPGATRETLIIFLHGFAAKEAMVQGMRGVLREVDGGADILAPTMPYGGGYRGWSSNTQAETMVADLLDAVDQLDRERGPDGYRSIIFTGHSFGAVLARKAAVIAHGECAEAPFEDDLQRFRQPRTWSVHIKRIVLLAGMNRGWSVNSAQNWANTAWWKAGSFFGELLGLLRQQRCTIFSIRQGAPFLIQLRLQWLALMRKASETKPPVVQLLGKGDDQVSPDDNVDFSVDLADGATYCYVDVPHTEHGTIVLMQPLTAAEKQNLSPEAAAHENEVRATRKRLFTSALKAPVDELVKQSIVREHMADMLPEKPNPDVKHCVFVIHGIRDKGFWTQKIARAIKQEAAQHDPKGATGSSVRSFTGTYGYFAMAPFMFSWVRRGKVEWLMDRYTELRARYPEAEFSYVGHSNGTYLLADALRRYPAAKFKHVIFAGSVVRRDYDWNRFLPPVNDVTAESSASARVQKVLNYVATNDLVVAIFPKAVQPLRMFDLGSAGFDGFLAADDTRLCEVRYVRGAHSAGIKETQWDEIARFIIHGEKPATGNPDYDQERNPGLVRWSERAPWVFWGLVIGVLTVGALLAWWMICTIGFGGLVPVAAFLLFILLVKTGITRL